MDHAEARAALAVADGVADTARRRARWYAAWCAAYAVLTAAYTAGVGLAPGPLTIGAGSAAWAIATALLSAYAVRQPVAPRHYTRLHLTMIGTWAVLYAGVLVLGADRFGDPAWWVPGALLTAVPPLAGAVAALRLTRAAA
ncbi:hypothetical protein [Nocardiopsis trehalosi]|jgi:hypothetical protein|uniref:hypothetical protein n=1 Tax=Nocardiopsis trehalosi TaxID=109329 RepID=UPI00082D06B1|nr:hypothetical protein [Nocardiopsis trehalosi]